MVFFSVGMAAWMMFESCALWATRSLEVNRGVLRRIDVPRIVPLVSAVAPGLLEFGLYLAIATIAVVYYGVADGTAYVQSPFGVDGLVALGGLATLALLGLGIGLWTSPFVAQARDIRFGFAYVAGAWLFLTPVIYPIDSIPEKYQPLAESNPATAPVEAFKHALLGTVAAVDDLLDRVTCHRVGRCRLGPVVLRPQGARGPALPLTQPAAPAEGRC